MSNEVFQRQIIFADRIFLNKNSLFESKSQNSLTEKNSILQKIEELNPLAEIAITDYCEIPMAEFFDTKTFLDQNVGLQSEKLDKIVHIHGQDHTNFVVLDFGQEIRFNFDELEMRLGRLIWENFLGVELLRVKGIVAIKGDDWAYSVQGVDETFEVVRSELLWEKFGGKPYSKFLFIGKNIVGERVREFLVSGVGN
jgi:G3E family GTPase